MKDEIIKRLRMSHKIKDKPSDLLQWIVDASPDKERTVKAISERIMGMNIAAIHMTTAVSLPDLPPPHETEDHINWSAVPDFGIGTPCGRA
jgi:hypothetical protein